MYFWFKQFLVLPVVIYTANCAKSVPSELDDIQERSKRWLSFHPYGGSVVVSLGFGYPLVWGFKHQKGSCGGGVYFQATYRAPAKIIWPVPESMFQNRLSNSGFVDNSRTELYRLLENMLDGFGTDGRECVLRAICEVAEAPFNHNGLFGELLDVVFTPYDGDQIDDAYKLAKVRGSAHMNCAALYKRCPVGAGLIEKLSILFGL